MGLTNLTKDRREAILESIAEKLKEINGYRDISISEIYSLLSEEEKLVFDETVRINPKRFGFSYPFIGFEKPKLIEVEEEYVINGEGRKEMQLVNPVLYGSFLKLKESMEKEIGVSVGISSGYRSPAYQSVLFFQELVKNGFDYKKTLSTVMPPGYSEHHRNAIDLMPLNEKIKKREDFANTRAYEWLVKNAGKFGFELSYPENNSYGIIFEPWHWRFKGF